MSTNKQILQKQDGRIQIARQVTTISTDYIMVPEDDVVIQDGPAFHTVSLPPFPTAGLVHDVFTDGVAMILSGNGNTINGVPSVTLNADQGVRCVWEPLGGEWVAGLMLEVTGGGSPILVSPITQGLVEYDELANPAAPFTKTFTDQWAIESTNNAVDVLVNPDPGHAALFDANGIILDPGTTTEVVAEINADQGSSGNGAGYKIAMSWKRNGAGAPIAMRTAQLVSDTYGTNAGAPPATWCPGLTGNVPQLALVGPIGGLYYCQPQVQGPVAATNIAWGGLFQWRKTVPL